MTIIIVYCDINRSDVKSYKSRQSVLEKEIGKGRRPEQISSNGSIFFVQTPESARDFAKRLIKKSGMNGDKDRLAVIDASQGKAFVWGSFEAELIAKFPFLIEACDL